MSRCVEHNYELLKLLSKTKGKKREAIINASENDLIKAISECVHNVLSGNVELTPEEKRKLAPKKKHLRDLADSKVSFKQKREVIQRGGNLLAVLLPPVIESLGRLFFQKHQ